MAMSEFKQKLLLDELAKAAFTNALYDPQNDVIRIRTDDEGRLILINDDYEVRFLQANREIALSTVKPLVDKVSEIISVWERSSEMPFEDLKQFRVLTAYNGIIMAARDDRHGHGFHFVTWKYNYNRTGLEHGHYTDDYADCKADFAVRSGLIPKEKLIRPEQVSEILAAITYRLNNDDYLSFEMKDELVSIAEQLRDAYPERDTEGESKSETAVREDAQIESIKTAKSIYGDIQPGDWVIAIDNNVYSYLLGTVTAIDQLGTPEHGTDNTTDDVHVDFTAFDYPPERIAEIENSFSKTYGEPRTFDELPLDDVIMAPKELISITHLGRNEIAFIGNRRHNCEAFCKSFISPSRHHGAKFEELVNRIDKNLADYHEILDGFGQGELIEMAGRIDVMNEAHHYLTMCYDFSADELDFYLKFENPLEIVANELTECRNVSGDLDYSMESLNERRAMLLADYPLIKEAVLTVETKPAKIVKSPKTTESNSETEEPKKTLQEKIQVAKEKVKAQDDQNNGNKSHKRNERN